MGAREWLAATAAGCVLAMSPVASWAQPKAKKAADLCQKKACEVTVVVGKNCAIYLVPEELRIKKGVTRVKITWTVDKASAGDVEFADDGVFFKTSGHGKELDGKLKETKKAYKWENRNELPGAPAKRRYDYGVNVVQDGKACKTYDPTIVNEY
jgi:hypothetical protein